MEDKKSHDFLEIQKTPWYNSRLSLKVWEPGESTVQILVHGQEKIFVSAPAGSQEAKALIVFLLCVCSFRTLRGLDDTCHLGVCGGQSTPLTHMVISPKTPFQTHPEVMFNLGTLWPCKVDT